MLSGLRQEENTPYPKDLATKSARVLKNEGGLYGQLKHASYVRRLPSALRRNQIQTSTPRRALKVYAQAKWRFPENPKQSTDAEAEKRRE